MDDFEETPWPLETLGATPEPPPAGRLLAVGDIHGHLGKLEKLMEQVVPTSDDQLVFLGDYIDRGPDSRGVIDYLRALGKTFPQTVFLRGNHEQLMLDALVECSLYGEALGLSLPDWRLRDKSPGYAYELYYDNPRDWTQWWGNGAGETLRSYGDDLVHIPQSHIDFLSGLPFYHMVAGSSSGDKGFLFVHAGLRPKTPLDDQDLFDLLWIRESFIESNYRWPNWIVVHGHTCSLNVPGQAPQRICVDSGVYRVDDPKGRWGRGWGKLTCCEVRTRQIWQAGP